MATDNALAGSNAPVLSVSDLSTALKRTVEDAFGHVRVRGEISQPKRLTSGHVYLRLKDELAVLEAVCWRGTVGRLAVRPEEGLEVIVTGKLTTYPGRSQYQLVIDTMELAGEGALLKMLEERRRRLAAEGLFETERKRPLPWLPDVIGVITSPTGAVIRDILHRLADRFPRHVLLWPVAVQGEGAAAQVAAAVRGFSAIAPGGRVPRPDVLIVARGGGSLEDLMAFNEEVVVRAVADCTIPVISAVGHETDTTLIDFVSDRRAPTPTAAAEMAVPVRADLIVAVHDLGRRSEAAALRMLAERATRVGGLARGLGDPVGLIAQAAQRLDDRSERLAVALRTTMDRRTARVVEQGARLRHPREVLAQAGARLDAAGRGLDAAYRTATVSAQGRFDGLAARLSPRPLRQRAAQADATLSELSRRLDRAHAQGLDAASVRLATAGQLLETLSHKGVLGRGYAYVTGADGRPVTRAAEVEAGTPVEVHWQDGSHRATVDGAGPRKTAKGAPAARQGSLF